MKLSAPKKNVFIVSLVLFILGLAGSFAVIPVVSAYAFWLLVVAFIILMLGNLLKGF
jgi:hypothetical protein